jgi:hypothetical protein
MVALMTLPLTLSARRKSADEVHRPPPRRASTLSDAFDPYCSGFGNLRPFRGRIPGAIVNRKLFG